MRLLVVAALAFLLAGCVGATSSSQASWTGGSGEFTLDIDCGTSLDLRVRSDVGDGELFFTVLDGADNVVVVHDLADDDLRELDQRLEGEAGTWKLGGSYDSMEGPGQVRISC